MSAQADVLARRSLPKTDMMARPAITPPPGGWGREDKPPVAQHMGPRLGVLPGNPMTGGGFRRPSVRHFGPRWLDRYGNDLRHNVYPPNSSRQWARPPITHFPDPTPLPQPPRRVGFPSGPWGGSNWNQMFGGAGNTSGMVDFARQSGYVSPIKAIPSMNRGPTQYSMMVRPEQRDALNAFMSYMHLNQNQTAPAVVGWNRWGGMGSDIRMPWEQRNPAAPPQRPPGTMPGPYFPGPQPQPTEPVWSADNIAKGYGGFWNTDPSGPKIMNFVDSDGDGRDDRYQFGPGQGGFGQDAWQANWDRLQQMPITSPGSPSAPPSVTPFPPRWPLPKQQPQPGGTKTGRDGIPIWTGGEAPRFDRAVPMPGPDWHVGVPGYDQATQQYLRDYEAHQRRQAEYQAEREAFRKRMHDWERTRDQKRVLSLPQRTGSPWWQNKNFQGQFQNWLRQHPQTRLSQQFQNMGGFPGFNRILPALTSAVEQPYSRTYQQSRIPMWMQSNQNVMF